MAESCQAIIIGNSYSFSHVFFFINLLRLCVSTVKFFGVLLLACQWFIEDSKYMVYLHGCQFILGLIVGEQMPIYNPMTKQSRQ